MFGKLAFEESWWEKFGEFTLHSTENNIKITNWQIKVWQIP